MKNILMLALAPIRKNKGQSASLFVFALITVMILNIGLVLFFGIGDFFEERSEINHAPHFISMYYTGNNSSMNSIEQGQQFMENDARVSETETTYAIGGSGEYFMNDVNSVNGLVLSRFDDAQKMDAPSLIGDYLPLTGNRIYIPNYIFLNGGYKVGDDYKLVLSGTELYFTVAGVTEEITFGSLMGFALRFYISDEMYNALEAEMPDNELTILSARMKTAGDTASFKTDYEKEVSENGLYFTYSHDITKQMRTMIPTIIAVVIAAFAVILLAVSLIVIRFRIVNGIEESMINIGAQKAIGYRNIQIITANVMQYGLIVLAGGFIGAVLAAVVLPLISSIFEPLMALSVWKPAFEPDTAAVSILLVLLTAILITYITSRKIKKLHPLVALRGGTTNHSFKKNVLPLDKSHGSLNLLLALKLIIQNKKQSIAISIIVAAVTMASVAGIAISYSMNEGRENFGQSILGEQFVADVVTILGNGNDGESFQKRVSEYPEVRKVLAYQSTGVYLMIDGIRNLTFVTEDYSLLEGNMLVEGFFPRHDNEIAVGQGLLKAVGKEVGETVTIQYGDNKMDFIITGIAQMAESGGVIGFVTVEGLHEVMPEFISSDFLIYVNNGVDVAAFIDRVQASEGERISNIIDTRVQMDIALGSMAGMFAAVTYGILTLTVFVVILTLYMIIKTTILRRRRELGIQKAVGFTTFQLMNQIALNMTPIILFGVAIGAVAGCFGFNPLMSVMASGMGMSKLNLPIPFEQIIIACIALAILAYAVSMLIAWRIRKISAYALVSE